MLLNLLIGRLGDIGLGVASVSIGSGLLLRCLLAVVLVALSGSKNHTRHYSYVAGMTYFHTGLYFNSFYVVISLLSILAVEAKKCENMVGK